MEISRKWRFSCLLSVLFFLATALQGVQGEVELGPSESECRPFIEKALKELETAETEPVTQWDPSDGGIEPATSAEEAPTSDSAPESVGENDTEQGETTESIEQQQDEVVTEASVEQQGEDTETQKGESVEEAEAESTEQPSEGEQDEAASAPDTEEPETADSKSAEDTATEEAQSQEAVAEDVEQQDSPAESTSQEIPAETDATEDTPSESQEQPAEEAAAESQEAPAESLESAETPEAAAESLETSAEAQEAVAESQEAPTESLESAETQEAAAESQEAAGSQEAQPESQEATAESLETTTSSQEAATESAEAPAESQEAPAESQEAPAESQEITAEQQDAPAESQEVAESQETPAESSEVPSDAEEAASETEAASPEAASEEPAAESAETTEAAESQEAPAAEPAESASVEDTASVEAAESLETTDETAASSEKPEDASAPSAETTEQVDTASAETAAESIEELQGDAPVEEATAETTGSAPEGDSDEPFKEGAPEDQLILGIEVPEDLRPREHIDTLLKLDDSNLEAEAILNRVSEVTLRELKRLYESAIKPLETLYKYRDLSNRHFGDSEIFSKPLVLFMGPWSGGKSSIINYLLDNEYKATSLRTGAEPSPAYFNLLMHGDEPEVLDGTQLAADFTFAGLQKFGQGLEERLRGLKLPSKLLEKINIVEIPGILEVRKQVSRVFPFNDACQWFIDRADIIFLVYDPSKLDVGPETEAILDQLKGREHQTRIILNKADQVKPEELLRVQGALIWNISPLMSSAQPPVMYTTSLWSRPYETWAPVRLLHAQERSFLRDLRSAVDKRIENKISSARRFAVRVRNHAKMVDCYLTTYYNHKSVFGNRNQVSNQIIEHPQDYHIYEGLSTLTNISRYDLPDPDVYRDFFRLNPLYDFQQLSATCTYFRGCPINRLDVAIAYDLPEMVGKHKKLVEAAVAEIKTTES